ncbi:MAG: 50S ribosomal protein L21 [Verrucomicrobiae bacterium]|nr:50S ribosomal protein L21 [Verrucomicrobiae bacterium]
MFAILQTGGKQYKVSEGDILDVELLGLNTGDKTTLNEVLLIAEGENIQVGRPFLPNAKVECEVLEGEVKAPKVIAYKFKRRKGYHRTVGHRQRYTRLKVTKIISQ